MLCSMSTENIWKIWLNSSLGQRLLAEEKVWFDKNLEDIFGYHAVQICPYKFNSLNNNRITYKYKFSFELCEGLIDEHDNLFTVAPDSLPLPSDSVDLFVLVHIFETLNEPHALLREVDRILRPEGKLIICSFNPYGLWAINPDFNASTFRVVLFFNAVLAIFAALSYPICGAKEVTNINELSKYSLIFILSAFNPFMQKSEKFLVLSANRSIDCKML